MNNRKAPGIKLQMRMTKAFKEATMFYLGSATYLEEERKLEIYISVMRSSIENGVTLFPDLTSAYDRFNKAINTPRIQSAPNTGPGANTQLAPCTDDDLDPDNLYEQPEGVAESPSLKCPVEEFIDKAITQLTDYQGSSRIDPIGKFFKIVPAHHAYAKQLADLLESYKTNGMDPAFKISSIIDLLSRGSAYLLANDSVRLQKIVTALINTVYNINLMTDVPEMKDNSYMGKARKNWMP